MKVERQKCLPFLIEGLSWIVDIDWIFLVEEAIIVEIKAIEKLEPIHEAQLLSYLKLSKCQVGLLINFNVKVLKDGIRRLVNQFKE